LTFKILNGSIYTLFNKSFVFDNSGASTLAINLDRELSENEIKENQREFFKWLERSEHLPPFLREFHDQKDVFKLIASRMHQDEDSDSMRDPISWVDAHIYTIDNFLRTMAEFGYTLQRSKKPIVFNDVQEMIREQKKADSQRFATMLNSNKGREK
jgi:hypothetical protein